MLRYKGELKPVILQMPQRLEEKRLENKIAKAINEKESKEVSS
jgi:hypothetical protein